MDRRTLGCIFPALICCLLNTELSAQTDGYVLPIGGAGAVGSEGGDPPILSDGSGALGSMDFSYDSATGILDLVVSNQTPQLPDEANPVITEIYFNIPARTDVTIELLSQTAPTGNEPSFAMIVDDDPFNSPTLNAAGGLGSFAVGLYASAVFGAIANPEASTWDLPVAAPVIGPVTFRFQVSGGDASHLTAADFALSPSSNPPGDVSTSGVFKFQAGGKHEGKSGANL